MRKLSKRDYELINDAKEAIKNNYNFPNFAIGSAIECKNGHVYQGLNIYSMHGCCAELIAFGSPRNEYSNCYIDYGVYIEVYER